MSTTPLDDLRVEVAAGPVRDPVQQQVQQHLQQRTSTAGSLGSSHTKSLDSWACTSANSSALTVCANARQTPRASRSAVASRAFRTVIYRTWPTGR
jgi:hypothetical protein